MFETDCVSPFLRVETAKISGGYVYAEMSPTTFILNSPEYYPIILVSQTYQFLSLNALKGK